MLRQTSDRSHLFDTDSPRWSDRQLAVFIELADAAGWHRHRAGLPETAPAGLTFAQRCRRRLAQVRSWDATASRHNLWPGSLDDEDHADRQQLRRLPAPLRHLRDPWGGAA